MKTSRTFPTIAATLACVAAILFLAMPRMAIARPHPLLTASAVATVTRDGHAEVVVRCDSLAFAMGGLPKTIEDERMLAVLDGPRAELEKVYQQGKERFTAGFEARVDGVVVAPRELAAPDAAHALAWKDANPRAILPVKLEFVARLDLPAGSKGIAFRFPELLGDVILTVQTPAEEPIAAPVRPGEMSDVYTYNLAAPVIAGTVPPVIAKPTGSGNSPTAGSTGAAVPGATTPVPAEAAAPHAASTSSAFGFIRLGFEHIIPEGLDHILFVLGLFFLSPKVKPLLIQITCFTLAHSVTLALSARGVVSVPSWFVEPAIAASIAFVAIENICTTKVHAWRPMVVFAFGLLHGLGFASAFAEAIGSEHAPLGPVLLFNVGVEMGQLAVVGIALLAVGWFRGKPWYRKWITIPASLLIAGMGVYWFIERVFF